MLAKPPTPVGGTNPMTDPDPWVHKPDCHLGQDDCHLEDCLHETRDIRSIIAIVVVDGLNVPMHPDCARKYASYIARQEHEALCRVNARWN